MDEKLKNFQPDNSEVNEMKKRMQQMSLNSGSFAFQVFMLTNENFNLKQKMEKLAKDKRLEDLERIINNPA